MEKKRLTIEFPYELWRDFKRASIDVGKPMRTIIVELIREWLQKVKDITKK